MICECGGPLSTSVIIPALDEEATIGGVLDVVPTDMVAEIIVVDGGSRDRTEEIAASRGVTIVRQHGRGYGAACASGVLASRGDVIVFLDADGSADPRDIPALVAPIASGHADMVLGSRLAGGLRGVAMPWHQAFGNWLCARLLRYRHGVPLSDLGPFRAVRRDRLQEIRLREWSYGWPTEMIVEGARAGWRIVEVKVRWQARAGGRSKISGTVRGTAGAALQILRVVTENPRG